MNLSILPSVPPAKPVHSESPSVKLGASLGSSRPQPPINARLYPRIRGGIQDPSGERGWDPPFFPRWKFTRFHYSSPLPLRLAPRLENWTRGRKPARSTFRPRSRAFLSLRERHTRAAKSDSNYVNLTKSLVVRDESLHFSLSLWKEWSSIPLVKEDFRAESRFNIRWEGEEWYNPILFIKTSYHFNNCLCFLSFRGSRRRYDDGHEC